MSEYKKGKYSFSLAPALVLVGKEIVEERKNQVEGFIRELEDYNIILRDLAEEEVSLDLRNELLNIAMYISENAEIYNEFYEKKELPINKISKVVLKPKQFLQKWREHIIVYSLILGNYNYKHISDYLKIIEKKEEKMPTQLPKTGTNLYAVSATVILILVVSYAYLARKEK